MKAYVLIRREPHYRQDAFVSGLRAVGYDVALGTPREAQPGDVLCIWNRYLSEHDLATRFEQQGGTVVVAENGYLGPNGQSPHEMNPRCWYALAIGGHNGSGTWNVGGPERWEALNVELKPWRTDGEHILVCPNRSFGRPGYIMPETWADKVVNRLRNVSNRPIRVRPHPGNGAHPTPLDLDLDGAFACVIWSSSAGVQALIGGIPVACEGPAWICKEATAPLDVLHLAEYSGQRNREGALVRMAHAQWHVSEIANGDAFRSLLRATRKEEVAESA